MLDWKEFSSTAAQEVGVRALPHRLNQVTLTKYLAIAALTFLTVLVGACTDSQPPVTCPSGMCTANCTDPAGCSAPMSCTLDSDCTSDVCLARSCVAESAIAYVAFDGHDDKNASCSQEKPCASYEHGVTVHTLVRQIGPIHETVHVPSGLHLMISAAPGASLASASPDAPAMTLEDAASVEVHGLHFEGAANRGVPTIDVPESVSDTELVLVRAEVASSAGVGIRVAGGSLVMDECKVMNNAEGGLLVRGSTSFQIGNHTSFTGNGTPSSGQGAIWIGSSSMVGSRIDNVFVTHNYAQSGTAAGIHCVAPNTVIRGSTVEENGNGSTAQIDGTCQLQLGSAAASH